MITRRRLLVSAAAAPLVLAGCKVRTINYFPVNPATVRFVSASVANGSGRVHDPVRLAEALAALVG